MAVATAVTYEDAWGEDEPGEAQVPANPPKRSGSGPSRDLHTQQRSHSSKSASCSGTANEVATIGAHSLQGYCLGCLGPYAEAFIEQGEEVLPFLPPEAKSSLLATARRQGILSDRALRLLVDNTWTTLDISFSTVSDTGLQDAMQSLPELLALDISGRRFHPGTLQLLAEHCEQLQILRLGLTGLASEGEFAFAIKHLMPRVTNPASASESWEALLPDSKTSSKDPIQSSAKCLRHLTYLLWPSIPTKTAATLARKFPKVVVNPKSGSCPAAADASIALDEPAIQSVAPFWQIDDEPEEPVQEEPVVPLSERFRLAYLSRAERILAKAERNYQQRRRRELRNNTVLQALAKFNYL